MERASGDPKGRKAEGREERPGDQGKERRASLSLPPTFLPAFFRSLGYRRIAISKFSKKSQKWRLFAHLGAKMH